MTRIFQQYQSRIKVVSFFALICWVGLSLRLFNIQIVNGKDFRDQGHKQGKSKVELTALRGQIVDRNNNPLTRNIIHYTIAADPSYINNKQLLADELSKVTGKSKKHYLKKLSANNNFVYLERNLSRKKALPIIEKNLQGVIIERNARRVYPQNKIAGQLLGFTNVDDIGLTGIEKSFDAQLAGTNGWIVKQRSGFGEMNRKNSYPMQEPVDGANVQLTIDLEYQTVLHEEMRQRISETKAKGGTGVIMNPQTGAILAMVSFPDYDPNKPTKYATENQKNRAYTDQFEPGSTFKIITAVAALDKNIVSVNDKYNCENGKFKYKSVTIADYKPFKTLTFSEIIEQSSNIGVIKVASKVGANSLFRYARDFGFGAPSNLCLSGGNSGTLRKTSEWSKISLAEVAMGHEVGVTALQLASAYSAIANGGILLKPLLIKQIQNQSGEDIYSEKPEAVRKIANHETMSEVTRLLQKAVATGTGTAAHIRGWQVAGKTGTAQKFIDGSYSDTKYISNFVGYLPASNPQVLGVIVLDEPKKGYHWGGVGAAPVFKRVMGRIIGFDDSIKMPETIPEKSEFEPLLVDNKIENVEIPQPIYLATIAKSKNDKIINGIMPKVRGMSMRKAIITLRKSGYETIIKGSGRVVWQSPRPGTRAKSGTICTIGLE